MSDKAVSSLTRTTTSDTGDDVYVVRGGNSRVAHLAALLQSGNPIDTDEITLSEIADPAAPSADRTLLYAIDSQGKTVPFSKDSAGLATALDIRVGTVVMYRTADGGNDPSVSPATWVVRAPNGSYVDISGSTTQGLQEAIDYAARYGFDLHVHGGNTKPEVWGVAYGGTVTNNGLQTFIGEKRIRIETSIAHNLAVGNKVRIDGTSGAVGGIPQAEFEAIEKTITAVPTATTFEFNVSTTNASSSTSGGGAAMRWNQSGQEPDIISCSTGISFPPLQNYRMYLHALLNFGGSFVGPAVEFDHIISGDIEWRGQIVIGSSSYTHCVRLRPRNEGPQDPFGPVITSLRMVMDRLVCTVNTQTAFEVDLTDGGMSNTVIDIMEPLGGAKGFVVTGLAATTAFRDNEVRLHGVHAQVTASVQIGTSTVNAANIFGNTIRAGCYPGNGATGMEVYGVDNKIILSVDDGEGTPTIGLDLKTSALRNKIVALNLDATTPITGQIAGNYVDYTAPYIAGKAYGGDAAVITPSQIAANQNDYNPTGLSAATVLRLSSDATRNLTGLQGGFDGRVISLVNVGSFLMILPANSGSSTAAYRFQFYGDDLYLFPGDAVHLRYDTRSVAGWHLLGGYPKFVRAPQGGTGLKTYAVGDLLSADTASSLSRVAAVATGKAIVSKGVTTLPAYEDIGVGLIAPLSQKAALIPSADMFGLADSAASNAGKKASAENILQAGPGIPGVAPNMYNTGLMFNASVTATLALSANTLYAFPFYVGSRQTWTRIGIDVTTGVAGNARLGIFSTGTDGLPGTLIADEGTVSTATTGVKEITISRPLEIGWYYLVIVSDATATIRAVSWGNNQSNHYSAVIGVTTPGTGDPQLSKAFAYAALSGASPFGAPTRANANIPIITMRVV